MKKQLYEIVASWGGVLNVKHLEGPALFELREQLEQALTEAVGEFLSEATRETLLNGMQRMVEMTVEEQLKRIAKVGLTVDLVD